MQTQALFRKNKSSFRNSKYPMPDYGMGFRDGNDTQGNGNTAQHDRHRMCTHGTSPQNGMDIDYSSNYSVDLPELTSLHYTIDPFQAGPSSGSRDYDSDLRSSNARATSPLNGMDIDYLGNCSMDLLGVSSLHYTVDPFQTTPSAGSCDTVSNLRSIKGRAISPLNGMDIDYSRSYAMDPTGSTALDYTVDPFQGAPNPGNHSYVLESSAIGTIPCDFVKIGYFIAICTSAVVSLIPRTISQTAIEDLESFILALFKDYHENMTEEEIDFKLMRFLEQMMFVSGETGDPSAETTGIIEEIVRSQVIEIVSP